MPTLAYLPIKSLRCPWSFTIRTRHQQPSLVSASPSQLQSSKTTLAPSTEQNRQPQQLTVAKETSDNATDAAAQQLSPARAGRPFRGTLVWLVSRSSSTLLPKLARITPEIQHLPALAQRPVKHCCLAHCRSSSTRVASSLFQRLCSKTIRPLLQRSSRSPSQR